MRVAIVNIGRMVSGDWRDPFINGDTIIAEDWPHRQRGNGIGQPSVQAPTSSSMRAAPPRFRD